MDHELDHGPSSTQNEGDKASESWLQSFVSPKVVAQALLFGLVNVVMALPTMYGYAAVIFRDGAYAPDMPNLSKLVCFSSAVHQVMFMLLSAMPFAIGQVQDAGLIFLSHIASNVAASAQPPPHLLKACSSSSSGSSGDASSVDECTAALEHGTVVSSCLVILGICTACLGAILVVVGRARLAKFVAYLPMPVISGYLAFIGFFCIEAGLSLCTGLPLTSLSDWSSLFLNRHSLVLCTPGMVAGAALCVVSRKASDESVLPAVMILIPLLFYAALFVLGASMDDAREFGWVGPVSETPGSAATLVGLFDFSLVDWTLLPQQFPVFASMVVVVAFSSCLDVAAIEMDVGSSLDVNSELQVVGWSNFVSGCCGGFTGSYIFSQTIFTCRSGCRNRIVGAVVAVSELVVVMMQMDLLEWVPLFFFAATLIFIGIDLLTEWLIDVRHKLEANEYVIVLLTFAAINAFGLNEGLGIGVLGSALQFLLQYASQANIVTQVDRQSMVLRTPAASAMIHRQYQRGTIATLELRGSLFFGSSLKILEEVKDVLNGRQSSSSSSSSAPNAPPSPYTPPPPGRRSAGAGRGASSREESMERGNSHDGNRSQRSKDGGSSTGCGGEGGRGVLQGLWPMTSWWRSWSPLPTSDDGDSNAPAAAAPLPASPSAPPPSHASSRSVKPPPARPPGQGLELTVPKSPNRLNLSQKPASLASPKAGGGGGGGDSGATKSWRVRRTNSITKSPKLGPAAFRKGVGGVGVGGGDEAFPLALGGQASLAGAGAGAAGGSGLGLVDREGSLERRARAKSSGVLSEHPSEAPLPVLPASSSSSALLDTHASSSSAWPASSTVALGTAAGNASSGSSSRSGSGGSGSSAQPKFYMPVPSRSNAGDAGAGRSSGDSLAPLLPNSSGGDQRGGGGGYGSVQQMQSSSSSSSSPSLIGRSRFLVLEFSSVVSIDATAVHSCFAAVCRLTQSMDCKLVYAGCIESVETQLRKHGAFNGSHVRIFPTLHRALDWCESVIIARARRNLEAAARTSSKPPSASIVAKPSAPGTASSSFALSFPSMQQSPLRSCGGAGASGGAASRQQEEQAAAVAAEAKAEAQRVGGERSAAGRRHGIGGALSSSSASDLAGAMSGAGAAEGGLGPRRTLRPLISSDFSTASPGSMDTSTDGMPRGSVTGCASDGGEDLGGGAGGGAGAGGPMSPGGVSLRRLTKEVHQQQPVLKVDTLLRQWLELRPEVPPAQVRPWLFLGGAHHACDRNLLERLDVAFVLNVADDIANFFEGDPIRVRAALSSGGGGAWGTNSSSSSSGGGSRATPSPPATPPQPAEHLGRLLRTTGSGGAGAPSPPVAATSSFDASQQPRQQTRYIKYCNLGVADYGQDAGIRRAFPEAIEFCRQAHQSWVEGGGTVLVHCRFGMNRSPTVLTAVLMDLEALSLKHAWRSLKSLCHSAYPQLDNRRELVAFEVERLQAVAQAEAAAKAKEQQQQQQEARQALESGGGESAAAAAAAGSAAVDEGGFPSGLSKDGGSEEEGAAGAGVGRPRANSTGTSVFGLQSLPPLPPARPSMGPDDFKSHGVDDAAQLSAYSRTEEYAADEALFRLGDHADELYLLLAGTVDLVGADGVTTKMSLSPGNVFGFVDSQLGKPRTTSAFARAPPLHSMARLGLSPADAAASPSSPGSPTFCSGGGHFGGAGCRFVVQVAAISMASLERMSADHPRIAVKLMKVLLRQSSLELSQQY